MPAPKTIAELLQQINAGDKEASDKLFSLVYQELHRRASAYLRRERPSHTFQTTDLVHEAYLKLVTPANGRWENQVHFFRMAARAMRQILTDYARKRNAAKRRSGYKVSLEEAAALGNATVLVDENPMEIIAIGEAWEEFARAHQRQSEVFALHFFSGHQEKEIARILNISIATVKRDWRFAKAWLSRKLED